MKKIPKLLLEHDKVHNKYDIYFLNKDEDNKIDKKTVFGDKQKKKEWEKLLCKSDSQKIKNCDGKILIHDDKIVNTKDEEGDTEKLRNYFNHLGDI